MQSTLRINTDDGDMLEWEGQLEPPRGLLFQIRVIASKDGDRVEVHAAAASPLRTWVEATPEEQEQALRAFVLDMAHRLAGPGR